MAEGFSNYEQERGRYDLSEAEETARRIHEKMQSGETGNYAESNKLVETEIRKEIDGVLPQEREAYFKATEEKHFDPEKAAGSLFTDAEGLQDLLERTALQRGSLEGDDREKFIEMGVPPEALLAQCRYLKVEARGEVGIASVKDLAPDTKVKVVRMKPGAPCSLVVEGRELPKTDFGTVVIGPNEKKPDGPEPSTKEMVWTVHPGLPVRPATEDYWPEGSEVTVGDVIQKLGDTVYLNVKKQKAEGGSQKESYERTDELKNKIEAKLTRTDAGGLTLDIDPKMLAEQTPFAIGKLSGAEIAPSLPAEINFENKKWILKDEFHVTLVGFGSGLEKALKEKVPGLSNKTAKEETKKKLDAFVEELSAAPWEVALRPEMRRIKKGENETLIMMCDLAKETRQAFARLQELAQQEFGVAIEMPPAHVTLYTLENGQAIGITTEKQLEELSQEVITDLPRT